MSLTILRAIKSGNISQCDTWWLKFEVKTEVNCSIKNVFAKHAKEEKIVGITIDNKLLFGSCFSRIY